MAITAFDLRLALLAVVAVLSSFGGATAQPAQEARWPVARLSADPNAAEFGYEFRDSVRGRFGDSLELWGGRDLPGYGLAVVPFVELHEPQNSDQLLPSEYWRARIALEQSYGFFSAARRFRIGVAVAHESDHETAHSYSKAGFLTLNDVAIRSSFALRRNEWMVRFGLDAQWFFLSCTDERRSPCAGPTGNSSAGAQLHFSATGPEFGPFAPFVAVSGGFILPHRLVQEELRISGRIGVTATLRGESLVSVFVLGFAGNDLGIVRSNTIETIGIGTSFSR